jgi:hypothetical protein
VDEAAEAGLPVSAHSNRARKTKEQARVTAKRGIRVAGNMCLGKVAFVNRRVAEAKVEKDGLNMKPYPCRICRRWHLATKR